MQYPDPSLWLESSGWEWWIEDVLDVLDVTRQQDITRRSNKLQVLYTTRLKLGSSSKAIKKRCIVDKDAARYIKREASSSLDLLVKLPI